MDQHIRILNLEDSAIDADLIQRELKRAGLGISIVRVETEAAFLEALETSDPDVILADYNLPAFDGTDALKIARNLVPEIPFIFVSGSIGEERATRALREGATDYVIKDRLSRLPSAVTRALKEKRERQLRQRAQDASRRSEERFRYAAQATQEVIWDWDLATSRMTFNDALRHFWGYDLPTNEVDASWWEQRIHPEDREATMRSVYEAIRNTSHWSGEYRFRRADGSYGDTLARAVIIRDPQGNAVRKICTMLDISELRAAQARTRESELRFRSVAETASDAIVLADLHGRIVFWNQGAERLFGYDASEMLGGSVVALVPERHRSAHEAGMRRYRETGEARHEGDTLVLEALRKDGSEFPIEMSLTIWTSGNDTYCTALIRDITPRVVADRRQSIQFAVAKTLAEAASVDDVVPDLLKNVGERLRWQLGMCWRFDHELQGLRCVGVWVDSNFVADELIELSRNLVLNSGDGLPGLVSAAGRAIAMNIDSMADSKQFPRLPAARRAGIQHGVAFPIVENGAVTAVVEFFKTRQAVRDDAFLDLLTDVGLRVGEFFERRKSEEKLLHSEASLAQAQEMARLGSFTLDATGILACSEQTYRIFGLKRESFAGTLEAYLSIIHPEDVDFVRRVITPPLSGLSLSFRYRIVTPGGEVRFVYCRARVVTGTAEAPEKVIGTVQDITDQIESVEMIQRLSHQNEVILNHAGQAIVGLDASGRITLANPAAAAITEWTIEELQSAPNIHDVIHRFDGDGPAHSAGECPLLMSLLDGLSRSGEDTFSRKSGGTFPAIFTCSPIVESSLIKGAVVVFHDVTERKRLEHQLEQANRVSGLGRVAATIAHEFNNVLMGIQPFTEVIRRRTQDEKTLKAAAQIANSVTRGKRVTEEILRFTQPSEPAVQPINCRDWLSVVLPELQGLVGPSVRIHLRLPVYEVTVLADPAQLQQVVTNLVLNARDAMGGRGDVTIAIDGGEEPEDLSFGPIPRGLALIRVSDTGSGMTKEVLKNIFEPLFTTKRTGTGLGLAVAQQVIRRHGGSIYAASQPGKGTTFFILLPTARTEAPQPVAADNPANPNLKRVVLVEDESAVASGITLLLEMEGISSRVAERGGQALDIIEAFKPDAVILDMSLPDMHGTDVYEVIAARFPQMPILFSSGHGDESSVDRYLVKPHVGFLRKPYDLAALMHALDEVTARPVSHDDQ